MTPPKHPHPNTACPWCDDIQNECCEVCEGTDQVCPICDCPAHACEFQEDAFCEGDEDEFGHDIIDTFGDL